jgi:hypothetical protein
VPREVAGSAGPVHPSTTVYLRQHSHQPTPTDPNRPTSNPQCFDAVMWLDVLAAKARCGMWLGGVLPEFTPWPAVFHARSGAAQRRRAARRQAGVGGVDSSVEEEEGEGEEGEGGGAMDSGEEGGTGGPVVRLKGLSHPLLLAGYQKEKERLQRQLRLMGADAGVGWGGQQQARRVGQAAEQQKKRRFLSNRKDNMAGWVLSGMVLLGGVCSFGRLYG